MFVLITYDVATSEPGRVPSGRRLRRVAKLCESYGIRVQKSVFECQLSEKEWVLLKHRLIQSIDPIQDSLRFYFLNEKDAHRIEHYGINKPPDIQYDTLIV